MLAKRFDARPVPPPLALGVMVGLGVAALAIASCGGGESSTGPGTGGNNSTGAAGTTGTAGTTGSGNSTGSAGASGAAGATGTSGGGGSAGGASGAAGASGSAGGGGSATGGSNGRGGATGAAGTSGSAGTTGSGGSGTGSAGRGGAGGGAGAAGATARGGASGSAGATGTTCTVATGPRCSGAGALNPNPFGCSFAWGRQNPSGSGSLSSYNYLQMVAYWIESGVTASGTYPTCSGCNWLSSRVAGSNLIPVYYAYMIGYFGHMNGLPDGNINPNGPNLATGGAALIKSGTNRQKIIDMYRKYAADTYVVWKTKPLIWFLEGDFIQYADAAQTSPLTMAELGQLAADITCAIKGAMPNAVVAINHTTWNGDDETTSFWCEMKRADYDVVWTTGVGNNGNFIESVGKAGYYNAATATYPYVHTLTGKNIVVDTSYGASAMSDSWSNQPANVLNNHIMNGVIGVNIANNPPSDYQQLITNLGTLSSTCR